MRVRPGYVEDLPALVGMTKEYIPVSWARKLSIDVGQMAAHFMDAITTNQRALVFVAVGEDEIPAGFVILNQIVSVLNSKEKILLEEFMTTAQNKKGASALIALVNHTKEYAVKHGCRGIHMSAADGPGTNLSGMQALYRRAGFEQVGTNHVWWNDES